MPLNSPCEENCCATKNSEVARNAVRMTLLNKNAVVLVTKDAFPIVLVKRR